MWTVRELTDTQICVGLKIVDGDKHGLVTYLTKSGHDTLAWVLWDGEIEPKTCIKNGDSDFHVNGWMR